MNQKSFKNGLIFGSLQPIHKGHMALINFGKEYCKELLILVCILLGDPIEGKLRFEWVQKLYKDDSNIKVEFIEEDLPRNSQSDRG